jgi:hypothetical protein
MMPKFLTIGYGDEAGYERTAAALRDQAHAHDAQLVSEGAVTGLAGKPVQVRNPDAAGVETDDRPYLQSVLPVAGFSLIEADDLESAVRLVAGTPCAIAHGVVEVWPLTLPNESR